MSVSFSFYISLVSSALSWAPGAPAVSSGQSQLGTVTWRNETKLNSMNSDITTATSSASSGVTGLQLKSLEWLFPLTALHSHCPDCKFIDSVRGGGRSRWRCAHACMVLVMSVGYLPSWNSGLQVTLQTQRSNTQTPCLWVAFSFLFLMSWDGDNSWWPGMGNGNRSGGGNGQQDEVSGQNLHQESGHLYLQPGFHFIFFISSHLPSTNVYYLLCVRHSFERLYPSHWTSQTCSF